MILQVVGFRALDLVEASQDPTTFFGNPPSAGGFRFVGLCVFFLLVVFVHPLFLFFKLVKKYNNFKSFFSWTPVRSYLI